MSSGLMTNDPVEVCSMTSWSQQASGHAAGRVIVPMTARAVVGRHACGVRWLQAHGVPLVPMSSPAVRGQHRYERSGVERVGPNEHNENDEEMA